MELVKKDSQKHIHKSMPAVLWASVREAIVLRGVEEDL
jgi:hypothetical protein